MTNLFIFICACLNAATTRVATESYLNSGNVNCMFATCILDIVERTGMLSETPAKQFISFVVFHWTTG